MGYQSARVLVVDDVADSLGLIQIWPADQEEEPFRHHQGIESIGAHPHRQFPVSLS